jgi:nucleotide-binding universal stress UspA family protein
MSAPRAPSAGPVPGAGSPFRRLLVPLDDSAIAPVVFMTAVQTAKALGAQIHLLRVLTIEPDFPPAAHVKPNGLEAKLLSDARTELGTWMASVTGVDFGPPQVTWGEPWRQILDVARALDVDLIVIGSHRHHGIERVLGTVASKIVNHADRDVLVVHRRPGAAPVSGQSHPR